ncbi:hypothetical protein BC830DRAFT_203972 [Chytriomyces sp. MP71]|nr:hypothetical protein BC830DRAFT_203972 [Chytriomyces sp. MP71]
MGNETSRPAEAEADGGDAGPADTRRPSTASSVLSRGETTSPTSATVAKGSVLSSLRSRIPVSAATTAAVMTATAATATGSDKERGAFFAGFDSVPSRELRPVFSALMAQAVHAATTTAAPLQSSSQKPILITELQQRLPSVVRVFIAAGDSDWEWERNALAKDVWPFLRRFCRVLNLDFEAVDLYEMECS